MTREEGGYDMASIEVLRSLEKPSRRSNRTIGFSQEDEDAFVALGLTREDIGTFGVLPRLRSIDVAGWPDPMDYLPVIELALLGYAGGGRSDAERIQACRDAFEASRGGAGHHMQVEADDADWLAGALGRMADVVSARPGA
jgi:hypothetical protein